jgi:putative transposase
LKECGGIWNSLLAYAKNQYKRTGLLPTRKALYAKTKGANVFSQVAQNVADRIYKSMLGMQGRKRAGLRAGFPRFKLEGRVKSFTYPQFGFSLGNTLHIFGIGKIRMRKHREVEGKIKTLTIKKSPSGKWFAILTSGMEKIPEKPRKPFEPGGARSAVGIDLGIGHFAYLSDGRVIGNPRHLRRAREKLRAAHKNVSKKKKGSKNRIKAKQRLGVAYEKLANRRADFLHKLSRSLVCGCSLIAMEKLKTSKMLGGFLAKAILDCAWAEFASIIRYKAEEAGCRLVFVNPAGNHE